MKDDNNMIDKLFEVLASLNNKEDCKLLLEDLCTYTEIEQMAQRYKAAQLLSQGKTYADVIAATNISSATLSRVSKCLHHGSGGYNKFVRRATNLTEE